MTTYNLGQAAVVCRGAFDPDEEYMKLNLVTIRGGAYICRAGCFGYEPGVTPGWQEFWVLACDGIADISRSGDKIVITRTGGTVTEFDISQ